MSATIEQYCCPRTVPQKALDEHGTCPDCSRGYHHDLRAAALRGVAHFMAVAAKHGATAEQIREVVPAILEGPGEFDPEVLA